MRTSACVMRGLLNILVALVTLPGHIWAQSRANNGTADQWGRGGKQAPRILVHPTDQFSTDGFLEFICRAEGNPQPIIQWYNSTDKQLITDRIPSAESLSGIHVNKHYGRLMISNPIKGKLYSFYCNASNEVGWSVSDRFVHGGVAFLDTSFRRLPENRTVNEGENVSLVCEPPIGLPPPTVFWMKDGQLIASQTNITDVPIRYQHSLSNAAVSPEGNLQIHQVQLYNAGRYVCVARNTVAERRSPAVELLVKALISFIETPKHTRAREGQTVTFRCQIDGGQQVRWRRGPGEGTLDYSRVRMGRGQLTISSVRLSDAGTYICFVPNVGSYNATLTVDSPPSFVDIPTDLSAETGQTVLFRCVVQGHPKPSIYWELPDKTPVFPSETTENQKYTVFSNGSLQVNDLQITDEGKYQCTAHSSVDTIHSSVKLRVIPRRDQTEAPLVNSGRNKPKIPSPVDDFMTTSVSQPIPFISVPPCNQTRMVGESVLLTCDVDSRRAWKQIQNNWSVRWVRRIGTLEQPIDIVPPSESQRFRVLRTGSLQITSLQTQDSGLYRCILHGTSNPPNTAGSTSMLVRSEWTAQLTVLSMRPNNLDEQCQDIVLPAPRNLQVTNMTSTSVTLVWEPLHSYPTEMSSIDHRAISYSVEYLSLVRPSNQWVIVEHNWPMNTVYLTGLLPNTIYYFLVRSRWMNGRIGRSSEPIGPIHTPRTLLGSPSASLPHFTHSESSVPLKNIRERLKHIKIDNVLAQVLADSQVHLEWTVTETAPVLQFFSGFTIRAQEVGLLRCVGSILEENSVSDQPEPVVQSPKRYCSLHYTDSEGLAGMVYRLEGLQRLHSETRPDTYQPAVIITEIGYTPRSLDPSVSIGNVQQFQGTLRTLRPFQCYDVRISAHSMHSVYGKVESVPSDAKFILTSERSPSGPPTGVAASWVAKTRAHIRWSAPIVTSWNGLLTGYVVHIYGELTQEPQIVNVSHSILSIDVDLPPRPEAYLVQVAAVTCAGVGVPSPAIRLVPTNQQSYLVNASSETPSSINKAIELMTQSWFVGTLIGSIVAWCIIIALVAFFCFRRRYKKRKTNNVVQQQTPSEFPLGSSDTGESKAKSAYSEPGDSVKMEPLLSELKQKASKQNGGTQLNEVSMPFVQSHSYAEYLIQQRSSDQANGRRKQNDTRSNDSRIGGGSQSISSSGGRSSMDALHQPTLVTTGHALSSPEPQTDSANHNGIPQSYSLSPSQYGWQSSPGGYPHDMLPPFQMNNENPSNISFRPNGFRSFWIPKRNGSLDRADGDSDLCYLHSVRRIDDGAGATPYATASILSATERHHAPESVIPKMPLSTICNAGVICYPCGNAQSSSDQASYTSNSDRFRTRPSRGYMNGRCEENGMTQSFAVHNLGETAVPRRDTGSKASRSPTTSVSRSSSKQKSTTHSTAMTSITNVGSTEHSLTSSRVTPQDEDGVAPSNNMMLHGDAMVQDEPAKASKNPYLPHFGQVNGKEWPRSIRDNSNMHSVNHVHIHWNGEYPHV